MLRCEGCYEEQWKYPRIPCNDSYRNCMEHKYCCFHFKWKLYELYCQCQTKEEFLEYLKMKDRLCETKYQQLKYKCRLLQFIYHKRDIQSIMNIVNYLTEEEKYNIIITYTYDDIKNDILSIEENILSNRKSMRILFDNHTLDKNKYKINKCFCKYCYNYDYHDYNFKESDECICKNCVKYCNEEDIELNVKEFNECSICYDNNELIYCKSCINTVCMMCMLKYKNSGRSSWNLCPCCKTSFEEKSVLNQYLMKKKKKIMEDLFLKFLNEN